MAGLAYGRGPFGHNLYVTDAINGDIYRVDDQANVTLCASTGDIGLAGLDCSSGGAFGKHLYVGSVVSGNLYQVDAKGNVTLWAHGFSGVAEFYFKPGGRGGFVMYMADGASVDGKVYKIFKE